MASMHAPRARYRQDSLRLEEARRELRNARFEGRSEDERITVTVNADGRLDDLRFDPRVFRSPVDSEGIAAAVKYAYDRATEAATGRKNELYGSIFGTDVLDLAARDAGDEAVQVLQLGRALMERSGAELGVTEQRDDRAATNSGPSRRPSGRRGLGAYGMG